jgi:coenzyme F420-reducing hydrogenase delta subunit
MSEFEPRIVAFYCLNCATASLGAADALGEVLPENIKMIQVPCTGRIEALHLLHPFEQGADGVYVAGCQEDSCQYLSGIAKVRKRVAQVKRILEELDMEPDRVHLFQVSAAKGQRFTQVAQEMIDRVKVLGPSPMNAKP